MKMLTAAVVAVVMAACMALPACDPEGTDAAIAEAQTRAVAAAEADGVDLATADEATVRRYLALAARDMLAEAGGDAPAAPTDWFAVVANIGSILLGYKGVTLGGQALYSVMTGKPSRATNNLSATVRPENSWTETLKALAALAVDTDTPQAAKPPAAPAP
jgi:hypothetical protein